MPKYIVNGKTYNIPDDKIEGFERKYPDANIEYNNEGKTYHIPISKRDGFLKQYPNAVAGTFTGQTEPQPMFSATATPFKQNNVAPALSEKPEEEKVFTNTPSATTEEEYIRGFGKGVKQGTQQLGAGLKYAGGEALDLISETSKDNADALAALEQMQAEGRDVVQETKTDAKSVLMPLLGHSGSAIDMVARIFGKKNPIANANAEVATDRTIRKALKETGGDVEAAKALLAERANEQTTADVWREEAAATMNEAKPTKGFGAWVGNMIPQMVGTTAGLGLSAVTKSPLPAQILGLGQMGALTASTAGASMKEARDAGATNGEVWATGLTDAVIELATEAIPFKGYLSPLLKQAKAKTAKAMADAVLDGKSPARKELQDLLTKANEQLGGKLFTAENAAKYIDDVLKEGASEFAAEALQTITPMLYAEPENYPTLWEVFSNGVEGLKGGIFMGAVLSGASNAATNKAQRDRRKEQGFVDVAEVKFSDEQNDTGIAEVLSYDPKTNQASVLFEGEIIPIDNASENIINSHRFTFDEFDRGQIDLEQAESYDNGRNLETPQEKNDAYNMYEYQAQNMRRIFGLDEDADVDAFIGDDPYSFATTRRNENLDDGQAVLDYLNAKATMDGLYDQVNDTIDQQIEQSNKIIDSRKNNDDAMIHPATMRLNDRKVYIISGRIKNLEDGTIDTANSDESIIIMDAETGNREFTTAADIKQADAPIDAEREKMLAAETITNTISDQAERDIEGVLPFNVGDPYTILDDQGVQHTVTIVADNGDGTVQMRMDNEQQDTTAKKDDVQAMFEAYNLNRLNTVVTAKKEQEAKVAESSIIPTSEQAVEQVEPKPRIPLDEQGEPMYEAAPVYDTWTELLELNEGNEEEAIDTANTMRENAQAELDKAMEAPKVKGKTVPEIQAAKAQQKALIQQAQDKLNYWTDVANYRDAQLELMKRAEQRATIAKAQAASQEKGRYSEENAALGAPIDFRDYVMRSIATGGVRFVWKDSETGTRGLGSHTGLKSNEERNARIWLLNNENGLYPEEAAEQLLTSYAEELGYTPNIDTSDALSEILDVVSSYATPSSMFEAAQVRHAEINEQNIEQEAEDAQARVLVPIAESLGLSLDEYLAWEEMMLAETLPAFEADYEQITAIFVEAAQQEEILNQNNDERSTENADVQSGVHSEGRLSDGSQAGVGVLQGEQMDNGIADSRGAEAGQGSDAQVVEPSTNDIPASEVSAGAEIIGENNWGKIYQWVKGKAVEGANFLKSLKNGYLKGVFYRREIGDIDLFWGNDKVGLSHIINKHIIKQDDFTGIEQAINSISDIIENGDIGTQEDGRVVISKDNYKVVIERTLEGNWIVTAYDKTRPQKEKRRSKSDATRLHQDIFDKENGELVSPRSASSENKDTTSEPQKQEIEQKNDDHRIVFDAFGKDYISQDGKNSFRITQIDGAKRVANVNVNTEAVGADNLEMTFEEVANLLRNGQWTEATSTPQQVEGVDIVTIKKDKHTKTGEDLFVAKIKDRVSRDEYNRIKGVAKEHNGYYSTAKRGFIFKTESDAEAFRVATQVPSAQMEDAKEVSLTELREVGSATNDIVEPIPTSDTEPQWKYELTVYDNGSTILERSRVMPNGVPVYDANFDMRAANPREMLDILNNPSNNMQAVLEQVGSRLEQRATVWDFREKARTEGVNGYKIGDTVKYTYNGKQEVGTIYDFEDYGDHNPILDLGTAPVLYVSAQWDQVEKVNEQPAVEQPKTSTPSGNKLVTDERYEELKRKMRQKLGGQMNMGIDPEILAIGTEMAVYHIEKGARKFADYASAMIADLGDMIRPYLKAFYNGARELPEVESAGYAAEMTTYDDVRTFDVSNFDKTAPNAMATAEIVIKEQEVSQQAEVAKDKIKNNRNKVRKTRNKSVSSSEVMDLFGTIEQTNTQEDDLRGDDAVRTEGLPADGSGQPLGLRESERGDRQGVGQEGGRLDGEGERSGSVQARTLSSGLLENPKNTRNNHAGRGAVIAPSSVDARIEANIRAIELSQQLIANEQEATPEQMAVLRQFSGWGGLGKAFNDNSDSRRIQELLGAEAYQDAVMSANSAYYTPTYIVDTLWDIATQLGFKGGNILEGSAGIGNILGQMPADISQRSDIRAIEIDSTAGNILSLLYPDVQVDIQGFEQTHIPNGSIDLAITNVPFVTGLRVNDTSGDKDLSKKFHNIHDFCIAKNVRKLREGGIGIFITSNGTLDNSKKLREWVTNQGGADFIGAFRLNNKTFGGTSVTSDIVVVRKRVNGQVSPNAIDVTDVSGERTAEYNTGETRKVKGVETPIIKSLAMDYNKYFIDRPENMAGVMRFGFEEGDTYRPTSKGLYPIAGKDQSQMLQEFVQSFTPEAFTARHENGIQEDVDIAQLLDGKKLGEVFVDADKLYIADADGVHLLDVNSNKVKGHTKVECFNAYVAIKDAVKDVLDYQTQNAGDDGLQPLLDKLNKAYDSFVKTYGHFNKNTAIAFLRNDVDYPNVFSLEKYEEIGDGKGGRIQKYEKSDVFKKRVIEKEVEPRPSNIKDGIIASIFKYGRVNVPYIAEQLQQSEADVKNGIIDSGYGFENPATREVEVSFQYLSGNIREKLRQAEDNNDDGQYNSNIKALKDIMPLDIPAHLIDFTLGSSWINPQLYDQYVKDRTDIDVTFTSVGGTWFMDAPQWGLNKEKNRAMGVVSTMLHKTIMGHTLIEAAMQNKTITVSQTSKKWDGSTETITDKEATQACAAKIDEIRQDFKDWARQKMQSDPDMAAQMERVYNDTFNNYVPMSIPADFVPKYFGGASHKWEMRPHQGKAIVRGTMQPLLLAHEVGTGKTFTLISIAMEMRRLGTARKPMVVVQNATVGQFVESAKALYPNAKILTLEEGDRSADGRKNFYAKIKYNDWDMIVVPQSTFEFIPDSEERQMAYIQDKIDEKMMVLQQMKSADANGNSLITRQAEKEIDELETQLAILTNQSSQKRTAAEEKKRAIALQNAEVKAAEMLDRRTDDVENFDDMGIDALLIDEAHEYKHLGFATAMQRGVKGVDPTYSKKSQGVYLKTQAVLEKNNGRNVIFATGTTISNTAAEIWTFMRYLMPADTMVDYGIYYFDDFVRNFGNIQQMLEFTTSGKFKESNRFAGYVNLPELIRIWSGVSDTVLTKEAEDVSDKIPEIEGGKAQDIYLPQTRALRSIMKFVKAQLEAFDKMSGKQKKENSHIPLTMYGIAKAAAVDARLVQADAEDDANSKTNEAVRQTLRSLNDTRDYRGTIAIFADNYQNKQSGFNIYEDIRAKLIDQGVSPNEIVVIKPGMTIKKKLEIFDKVNKGDIRVILGSTFTLGTGVNIQERLHTVIHLDAPNRPMDYTQRNGRILRQGNLHKDMNIPVRVLRFGVEDSLDVTAYQRLKTKGAIADSIMGGKQMMANSMINRVLEEEEDVFGDTVAQLSGSEYAMLKNNAEKNVRKYESRRKQWEADQTYIHNAKPRLERKIADADQSIKEQQGYLDDVQKEYKDGKFKSIVIGKKTFNSVDDMAEFIKEYNKTILDEQKQLKDGALSGSQTRLLPIKIDGYTFEVTTTIEKETNQSGGQLFSEVHRKMSYSCPELGLENIPVKQALLRNAIEDITENVITGKDNRENIEALESITKNSRAELKEMQAREGKPFEFDEELAKAKAQYVEYSELMKKEMEEKEAKYAEMDASVEAVQSLAEAEEDGEYRDRVVSYEQQFADLQSEYDALDKDDTEALNEWREKKRNVLQSYMDSKVDELNLPVKDVYVYDGTNDEQIENIYDAYVRALDLAAEGRREDFFVTPPIEQFMSLLSERDALYLRDADIAVFNANAIDNNEANVYETMLHEQTHGVVARIIPDNTLSSIWEDAKKNSPDAAKVIASAYIGQINRGDEFLTYYTSHRLLFSQRNRARTEAYIKGEGNISADELINSTQDLLPLTNDTAKQILNFYRDEYRKKLGDGFRRERNGDEQAAQGHLGEGIRSRGAGNTRREIISAATDLAASLGVKLNVVDAIPNAPKGVKGRYSISTDQVYFVLPNATSVEDAVQTVLHEVVAHKGLRDVVGRDHFEEFLGKVFRAADTNTRRKIVALAARNGWDFNVATEEYLASLAEQGFDSRENRTFLQKVRDLFMDMFRAAKIVLGFNINDNDMRYMLWRTYQMQRSNGIMAVAEDVVMQRKLGVGNYRNRSMTEREQIIADAKANGTYLKAPNGKDTNLTPDQWVTARTDAFKKWFGDWENDPANASKVVDANGEPKVVYNGSKVQHYNYDGRLRTKGQSATNSKVSFFTDNKDVAERYGKFVNEVFLNIRNPYEIDYNGAGWQGWSGAADGMQRASTDSYADLLANGSVDSTLERIIENYGRAEADYLASGRVRNEGVAPDGVIAYEVADPIRSTLYIVRNAEAKDISRNSVTPKGVETFTNLGKSSLLFDSQIKSATDNVGTFDPSNDDIRYRVAPSTPSTGEARQLYDDAVRRYTKKNNVKKTENLWHHLREAYQDSMLSVKKLMDAILAETGNKLRGADDVYRAENQLSSKNKAEIEKWERDFMKPLQLEILDLVKKGASYEDIVEYLLAKHGLERNLEFSRREAEEDGKAWDGFVKRDFSGLTELTGEAEHFTEAAQQIVEEFEGKYNTDNLWSKINAATKESLKKSYDSGLMSKETYDKVANMFQYYIPLRGWDNNVAADQYEYMANKGMKILPALKTAKGRTSRADDPIATLGSVGESSIIQGNRNLMKQKFLNFAQNNPTSLLTISEQWYEQNADGTWRPSNPEIPEEASADEVDALIKEHEAKMEALGDKATKKRQGLNINLHATKWEQEEHAVNVKRNGKEYKIFVNGNPVAAQAINGFTNPDAKDGEMKKAAMWVKNFMARAFTSMNPAFVFSNLARDLIWAGTSVAIKENAAYARQYSKNISNAMLTAQLPKLVSKWKKGTLDMNNPIEKYFHEFITNGGETGFTQLNTVDDYKRNMERFIKEAQGGVTTKAKKGWRWIWDNVEFLNRSAEDTTRFMVYLTSRQMGRPITESIANAKDITVNFNKKGRGGFGATYMNFAYIFFNATIQSLANFGKLIANHPKKTAAALTTFGASGMIAPMTALALQAMLSGDDDEPTYWDLPEWVRRNNIVIYVGGSGYVTIPLPHELRPFYGMGELAFSTLMGKEEPDTALAKAAAGFASLMPFDYTGNAGNAAVNFTPTIAQPIAQLIVNKDYFGTPIYRKTAFNEQDPEWTKAYKSTNQLLVGAAEFLNEITGGDEVKNGLIDLNPAVIEHLYEGYLGGMGKTINRAAKTLSMLWNEDARTWRNVPIASSFYQVSDERTSGSQVNREYFAATDEADEIEHLYRGYNKRAKMGSIEYAEKLNELITSDVFKRYQKVNSYKKAITKLNEALKQADATDREQIETLMMELKVDMLEELEQLNNR